MRKKNLVLLLFVLTANLVSAQRHTKGTSAIEVAGGIIASNSELDPLANISFSQYLSEKSYFKIGFTYFNNSFKIVDDKKKANEFLGNLSFFYTLYSNNYNLYINLGIEGVAGYEKIPNLALYNDQGYKFDDHKSSFIAGGQVSLEMEYFFYKNFAFLLKAGQQYNTSKFDNWYTPINIGLKTTF